MAPPVHKRVDPVIGVGVPKTVTVLVAKQTPMVYDIVEAPKAAPVTFPEPSTLTFALLALHIPPVVASVKAIVVRLHNAELPEIVAGWLFTVTAGEVTDTALIHPTPGYVTVRL